MSLRTSVRLSLQFSFLYSVLSALVFTMAFWLAQYEIRDTVLKQMRGDAEMLRAIHDKDGPVVLIDRVAALAAVSFESERIYQLQNEEGGILSGNIVQLIEGPVPDRIPASRMGLAQAVNKEVDSFWMQETRIGPYRLVQGTGDHLVAEVMEGLGAALVAGFLVVSIAGLVIGIRVGRITESRITAILTTLSRLSGGELSARVPVHCDDRDDLSRISVRINAMLDQIAALVESQQQISNDIAHDMRTPLQRLHQRLERMGDEQIATRTPPKPCHFADLLVSSTPRIAFPHQTARKVNHVPVSASSRALFSSVLSGLLNARFYVQGGFPFGTLPLSSVMFRLLKSWLICSNFLR